ncbi:MAG: hypothetical protein QOE49_4131 [Rhodospirillaceae bacterium]|jgi:hypothetical protein|nr:hypothetical protein [Rhodospirillaceae bacterium]
MAAIATSTAPVVAAAAVAVRPHYLEWGSVILGALGATAISVVLLTFGAALGLSIVSPYPYAGISAKGLAVLTGTYVALVTVASFGAGGYLAGRLRSPWTGAVGNEVTESHFRDGSYGFGVWALGVLLGSALAVSGVGGVLKAAVHSTTAVAAAGTAGAASNPNAGAALSRLSMEPTDFAVDRVLAPTPAPAGAAAAPASSRADLAAPVARVFAANLANPQLNAADRSYLVQLVMQQTGLPQADAEKRVDQAFTELKAAEQKARDAAEQARKATLIAAFLAAATLAVGCAAACGAASLGGRHRDDNTLVVFWGSRRFW